MAESAGGEVCGVVTATRDKPDPGTFIGSGKLEELADKIKALEVDLVVVNHPITPIQERNLERGVKARILDRTGLILDIFSQRASSSEGKLQVELAQLKHLSTRLVRGWTHLERQKGGIGLRGPGETQLETDRRLIGHRIKTLTRKLKTVESQRSLRRRSRAKVPVPVVSLVGYTNAGKSTLFNTLTGENIYAEDKLFATLDPTMRRLHVPKFGDVVLSDTVGFIKDLPHSLVVAFHSTLEEVVNASLLLHVVDISSPDVEEHITEVNAVLEEIGADEIPMVLVNNKIDVHGEQPGLVKSSSTADEISDGNEPVKRVNLSAVTGQGISSLFDAIYAELGKHHHLVEMMLPPEAGKLRASLYQKCEILDESITEEGVWSLKANMSEPVQGWLWKQADFDESFVVAIT